MSSMLDSVKDGVVDAFGLKPEPIQIQMPNNANKAYDDFSLGGKSPEVKNGINVATIDNSIKQVHSGKTPDKIENGTNVTALDKSVANAQAQIVEKELAEEGGGSWKEWVPDANWNVGQGTGPGSASVRGGGGYRYKPDEGMKGFYNLTGNMSNMSDPLNSQVSQRIAGRQKQLLGL